MKDDKKTIQIRAERRSDYDNITRINDLAFGREDEGRLISTLRTLDQYDPQLSLVALWKGSIVGHILFYPISIENGDVFHDTISLAPMAVMPDYQGRGIGMELIMHGLSLLKKMDFGSVVVLGDPEYYPRFGFQRASRWGIKAPFEYPDEAFMALELIKEDEPEVMILDLRIVNLDDIA